MFYDTLLSTCSWLFNIFYQTKNQKNQSLRDTKVTNRRGYRALIVDSGDVVVNSGLRY